MSTTLSVRSQVGIATASAGLSVLLLTQLRRWQWARRRQALKASSVALPADTDILRIGFSSKKLPKEIDHIVIGSGVSGLYIAALLSKMGRKVVVLEQHYVAGGCTHTFQDQGYEFDTGVHYMGGATTFTAWMDFCAGKHGAFKMVRQGDNDGSEVYNEFSAGNFSHRFRPAMKTFVADLVAKFPQEERALKRFMLEVQVGGAAMGLLGTKLFVPAWLWNLLLAVPGPMRWIVQRYYRRTLNQALDDAGLKDPYLRATLSAEFGDYGTTPAKAPFFLHAGILNHYLEEGGFAPLGGSDAFGRVLVQSILDNGSHVFVRAPVSRIVEENGRAVGVECKGNVIKASRSVISSAGVHVTYRKLLDEVQVQKAGGPPKSLLASEKSGGTGHHVYGFFGLDGKSEDLSLPTINVWSLPDAEGQKSGDLDGIWGGLFGSEDRTKAPAFLESDEKAEVAQVPAFISFPSAKDPEYNDRCPGKSAAIVLTEARPEYFGKVGPTNKRGEEYAVIKKRYEKVLLNALYRHFPHLKGKVSYIDVGTPFSNEHYLGRCASYGLDQDAERFLDPTLRIEVKGMKNLYLTGQDILAGGVFPQALAAWMTFAKAMGFTSPDFWIMLWDFLTFTGKRVLFDKTYRSANA
eukprot:TRINITY_DN1891_c0_g1_i1.p1 TRINITY_DN1891_c0_g1~~TRINITY_DN1891_c0_g1_i1.p1  ORF type:complete len:633 (+),score=153.08 TRINITY_DN1891_c0_g1_i1:61-1959(+)